MTSIVNPQGPRRIETRSTLLGQGTLIRRALPSPRQRTIGAWCFLDHAGPVQFGPDEGMHVGPHPHIGLQTFSWLIEGEVMHRDSLGVEQVLRPGEVNLMTAGRGISHSEDTLTNGGRLHLAQLWIALPEERRQGPPAFAHHPVLPRSAQGGWALTLLAGEAFGETSPVEVFSPLLGLDLTSTGPAEATLPLRPDFEHGVLVLRGEAVVAGERLAPGTLLALDPGREALTLQADAAAQVLLLGGEPLAQPPLLWWNFVAPTQAEMEAALADWHAGGARFGTVQGAGAPPLTAPSLAGLHLKGG